MIAKSKPKFNVGRVVATPGAIAAADKTGESFYPFLTRHQNGDWGDVGEEDAKANDTALETGERLLSIYHLKDGTKLWVITEADRSSTCFLLPEEY